ncbi:hypothetical protein [Nonomuraea sp. SYSU D8015]|uniref:hypothetical protein n=1 Tax=Nonomuraea sp. SYSU D8015 TaxID=2593644 RepID=UPI001660B233|nr:hypothetical protein [Nonomuraea sp. SYSU D8015]
MATRPRTTCPICTRDVVQRKDGTPVAHYPPPGRPELTCGGRGFGAHCRGSHPEGGDR